MIDLHSHTDQSDGTFSAAELVAEAVRIGLRALAITDHDTMAGYELAVPLARAAGRDLVCGIELSTRFGGASMHLLGYFPCEGPSEDFRAWLGFLQASRRDRNRRRHPPPAEGTTPTCILSGFCPVSSAARC